MPISRGLVISLGTSVLGCTLLFLYFRNRMSVIERKVDVMFDLIQNHNQQQQPMKYEEEPQNMQFSVREKEVEVEDDEDSRIVVSDDEASDDDDAFDSDDSVEVSDNEEEDTVSLNLKNSQNIEISDIKTITLDGPENSGDTVEVDSLDEIDDDDDDDDDEVQDDNEDNISADKQEDNADEDEDEDDVEDVQEDIVVKEIDYSGLKVSELKAIAKEKGLSGYRSLKKNALVNLLKGN